MLRTHSSAAWPIPIALTGPGRRQIGQAYEAGHVDLFGAQAGVEDLREFCVRELGRYKTPKEFRFLAELPKGPSGKVQRLKLL